MSLIRRTVWRVVLVLLTGAAGFVAGTLALYVYLVRSGPDLQPWHEVTLEQEFTAGDADRVADLAAYRALEDRLYRELDARVYGPAGTAAPGSAARYERGSPADPRTRERNWNRTFELRPQEPRGGFLLLHGLSDSPYSVRALGRWLHAQGFRVLGLRIPGHGTAPSGLTVATWEDWAAAVRLGMAHLHEQLGSRPVHVLGYSNGAALAVDYALRALDGEVAPAPASLVLLSPAVGVSPAAALAGFQARLASLPGLEKMAWTEILPEFDPYKYNSFAVNAGVQIHRLTGSLKARVEQRAAKGTLSGFPPVLAFLSAVDATVSVDAVVDNLLEHLQPGRHELVLFDLNRAAVGSGLLRADPGPITRRLLASDELPFALDLVTNESASSLALVSRRKPPRSAALEERALPLRWPPGVFSLSHVALPFPPDDPLYGDMPPAKGGGLYLGRLPLQGERQLLLFSADWLLRLRHNPFFDYLQQRLAGWLDAAGGS